jgi:sensor histidine kinase YesM
MENLSTKALRFILIQLRDLVFAFLISTFVIYLFIGKGLFQGLNSFIANTQFGFLMAVAIWKGNQLIHWASSRVFPWTLKPKLTLLIALILSIIYTIIIIVTGYFFVFQIVFNINFQNDIERFFPQMLLTLIISLLIIEVFYLFQFFKWWRISTLNEAKLQQETIQLRYDALKSQINPHFLFNSLSVLSSLVDTDTQKAKEFIQQFSNIYRYVLEHRESELVPLSEEVSFIKSFTNLHLVRHGENLQVSIDIGDTSGFIIPLSLQILLENCFKHNVISEEKPLNVKVWRENDFIIVQNNFQKRNTIHDSGGIGLETICKRYEYLSDIPMKIEISSEHYTVKLPILKKL